jgi:hypothetical protein
VDGYSMSASPISQLKLQDMLIQVMAGKITRQEAQQQVAYVCWQERLYEEAQGDAMTDWNAAASLLNRAILSSDLDIALFAPGY